MAEVLLFHHALGLTEGVLAFADGIRQAGHTVHTPDLYDGHTFTTVDEGLAYARKVGLPGVRSSSTPACRSRSSVTPGRRTCPCRSTPRRPTRFLWTTVISRPRKR